MTYDILESIAVLKLPEMTQGQKKELHRQFTVKIIDILFSQELSREMHDRILCWLVSNIDDEVVNDALMRKFEEIVFGLEEERTAFELEKRC